MLLTYNIKVSGKVQGVFYRQSAKEKALELGITGHVKNLSDGSVEMMATGTKEQLEKFLQWCRQGPPRAKVTSVETKEISPVILDGFSIVR